VVSAAMKIQHTLTSLLPAENKQQKCVFYEGLAILLQLLAPITPHICQSIWHACHFGEQIIDSSWPEVDLQAITCKKIQMIIQVNGKVRSKIQVDAEEDIEAIKQLAQEDANIIRHLEGKTIRKIIVVPQKLINIVAST
jgi:leucyl-tRNA synthetase